MAMLASTQSGALGSASSSLKVFQDFFVDLDLPVMLTQGDQVSIPIAIYNYLRQGGHVSLKLQPEDWYSLNNGHDGKVGILRSGRVGGSSFTSMPTASANSKLTTLRRVWDDGGGGNARQDVVVRDNRGRPKRP